MKPNITFLFIILCLFSFEIKAQTTVKWTNIHNLQITPYGLRYNSSLAEGSGGNYYGTATSVNAINAGDTGWFNFVVDSVTAAHTLYGFTLDNYLFASVAGYNYPNGDAGTFPGLVFYIDIHDGYGDIYEEDYHIGSITVTSGDTITIAKYAAPYYDPFTENINFYKNGSLEYSIPFCETCLGADWGWNFNIGVVVETNGGGIDPVQCIFDSSHCVVGACTFGAKDYSVTWDTSTFINAEMDTSFTALIGHLPLIAQGFYPYGKGVSANKLIDTLDGYVQTQWLSYANDEASFGLISYKNDTLNGNVNAFMVTGDSDLSIVENDYYIGSFGHVHVGDVLEVVRLDGYFGWVLNGTIVHTSSYNMFDYASPTGDGDYGMHAVFLLGDSDLLVNLQSSFGVPLDTPVISASITHYCANSADPFTLSVSNLQSWANYRWYKNGTLISGADSIGYRETAHLSSTTTYQAKVIDNYGDTLSSNTVSITVDSIILNSHLTNVACHGGSTGIDSLFATNGAGSYTYSWSPSGGTNAAASSLAAGSYTVTVTDADGCSATKTDAITQPSAALSASITNSTNIISGDNINASAIVTASGGTSGYTYSWSPSGGTDSTATGLMTETYTATVTDAHGCTTVASIKFGIDSTTIGGELLTFSVSPDSINIGDTVTVSDLSSGFPSGTVYVFNDGKVCAWDSASGAITYCSDSLSSASDGIQVVYNGLARFNINLTAITPLGAKVGVTIPTVTYWGGGIPTIIGCLTTPGSCDLINNGSFENALYCPQRSDGCGINVNAGENPSHYEPNCPGTNVTGVPGYGLCYCGIYPYGQCIEELELYNTNGESAVSGWNPVINVAGVYDDPFHVFDYYLTDPDCTPNINECDCDFIPDNPPAFVPNNSAGSKADHSPACSAASGYIGMLCYNAYDAPNDRAFAVQELTKPMTAGNYQVTFYVALAKNSGAAVNGLGIKFASQLQGSLTDIQSLDGPTNTDLTHGVYQDVVGYTGGTTWTQISGIYTSPPGGNEQYVYLGDFISDDDPSFLNPACTGGCVGDPAIAYYYFDDVSVVPMLNISSITTTPESDCTTIEGTGTVTMETNDPGPFTYLWTPLGRTGNPVGGLLAGFLPDDPDNPGPETYTVTVTDGFGCSVTGTETVDWEECRTSDNGTTTASHSGESVKLYPNPTTGNITVIYHINSSSGVLQLYDMVGKKVSDFILDGKKNKFEFDMGDLCCGIFEYRVMDSDALAGEGRLVIIR